MGVVFGHARCVGVDGIAEDLGWAKRVLESVSCARREFCKVRGEGLAKTSLVRTVRALPGGAFDEEAMDWVFICKDAGGKDGMQV